MRVPVGAVLSAVALACAGCGGATTSSPPSPAPPVSTHQPATPPTPAPAPAVAHRTHRRRAHALARPLPAPGVAGLVYSDAPNDVVHSQPVPGTCHARGTGLYSRPDPSCTPGALNPAVTQAKIDQTICRTGWTETVRPPESITEPEKGASLAAYGEGGSASNYEYDHLVPLELGGATNDARNLWTEPGASPNPKDAIEDTLRAKVCAGAMSLAAAQRAIVANWTTLAARAPSVGDGRSAPPATNAGHCTVTASYNARYGDYDVDVASDVPDATVTVTDAAGARAAWHTDASGYADVYFRPRSGAAGETVTARVGGASCSTSL